jgi:hypothetical protein
MSLEAIYNAIIVKPMDVEETSYGSIIVPDLGTEKNKLAEVVSVGSYLYSGVYRGVNVDMFATLVTPENLSTIKGLLPNESIRFSTSVATVATAANSKSISAGSSAVKILSN